MLPFVFVSILSVLFAFFAEQRNSRICMCVLALLLASFSGLRGPDVGIDTDQYYYFYEEILQGNGVFGIEDSFISFCEFLQIFSPDPALLIFVMSFLTNVLIVARLWTFRKSCSFAVMIAVYLAGYYPESMNIMRQFFAVALIFGGSYFLEKNKPLIFIPFLVIAISMHTSSIVGILLLFVYLWSVDDERKSMKRAAIAILVLPSFYIGYSRIMDAYEIYSRYFETVKQNFGFMLMYKMLLTIFICYISRYGFIRKGNEIVGQKIIDSRVLCFYVLGLCLCSLGMFFPYIDRIGLYFLMFEMPFWGWAVKSNEMSIPYRVFCYIFIGYLFLMTLLTDGHDIFPYKTIWGG